MKTAIKVIIALQIVSDIVSCMFLLFTKPLWLLLAVPLALLGLVIPFALLYCLGANEQLQADVWRLKDRLNRVEHQYSSETLQADIHNFEEGSSEPLPNMTAKYRWTCVKCQTVNREGTSVCENCGSHYSFEQEKVIPAPLTRWKKLKDKKRK